MRPSGSFSDYLSNLHARGYAGKGADGRERITPDREVAPPPSAEAIIAVWGARHLRLGQRRMLQALHAAPDGLTRDELAAAGEMAMSGSFSDYLSNIHASGLVAKSGDRIHLSASVRG